MTPIRIQRSRTKGWKMPENTVVVSRPTKWGNPFSAAIWGNAEAVQMYRRWLDNTPTGQEVKAAARIELRGKNLACWCAADCACHADVLLEIANEPEATP